MLPLHSTQTKCNPRTCHEPEEKGCWAESWQQTLGERGTLTPAAARVLGAGEEAVLASPVLAELRRQAGQWVLCCPSPRCSRQLPSASWAPSARQIGTACVPSKGGTNPAIGGRGWLVQGCAQPAAGLLKSGRASPLVFNLLWIVAIIIRIISSR